MRAVETSIKVCEKRRRLPHWQEADTTESHSAIAAIHQMLNAFPEEVFDNTRGAFHFVPPSMTNSTRGGALHFYVTLINQIPSRVHVADPRAIDLTDLAQSVSSGSEDTGLIFVLCGIWCE